MKHELPPLPYPRDALEPHISAETLEFHHGKHHRAYVDKLNELIRDSEYADLPLEQIITATGEGPIFNNAAQVWNHTFYWQCMSPDGGGDPKGPLADAIARSFGSVDAFRSRFDDAVKTLFGSGWAWLVRAPDGSLTIEQTSNAHNPLGSERQALLTCDTWEHAFYIDYRNDKGAYLNGFWNVVNWDFAAGNLG
ncbi:MAG TPA: superoxide dismutase [Pseudomonadales bacterium]